MRLGIPVQPAERLERPPAVLAHAIDLRERVTTAEQERGGTVARHAAEAGRRRERRTGRGAMLGPELELTDPLRAGDVLDVLGYDGSDAPALHLPQQRDVPDRAASSAVLADVEDGHADRALTEEDAPLVTAGVRVRGQQRQQFLRREMVVVPAGRFGETRVAHLGIGAEPVGRPCIRPRGMRERMQGRSGGQRDPQVLHVGSAPDQSI